MSTGKDWRIETDGMDYFRSQKKTLEVADRRPVIRKAGDLVGPGIGANTTRLTDYNDLLATFNGYFSSAIGALNAPTADEAFVGEIISDAELGGMQVFTGLSTGIEYRRTFSRSPIDPEALSWSPWIGSNRLVPSVRGFSERDTNVLSGTATALITPTLSFFGPAGYYSQTDTGIQILRQGIYTGVIQIGDRGGSTVVSNLTVYLPDGTTTIAQTQLNVQLVSTVHIPFTVRAADGEQGFTIALIQSSGVPRDLWWRFSCARIGDTV